MTGADDERVSRGHAKRDGAMLNRVSLMLNKCSVSRTRAAQRTSTCLDG